MTLFNDNVHEPQGLTTPSLDFRKEMVPVGFGPATSRFHTIVRITIAQT